jgi:hypothetical protein
MRKIILLGFASLVLVCGAVGADARSSDEEDTPQATTQTVYAPRFSLSPADVDLRAERRPAAGARGPAMRAERKPVAGARRPTPAPAQEDDHVGY